MGRSGCHQGGGVIISFYSTVLLLTGNARGALKSHDVHCKVNSESHPCERDPKAPWSCRSHFPEMLPFSEQRWFFLWVLPAVPAASGCLCGGGGGRRLCVGQGAWEWMQRKEEGLNGGKWAVGRCCVRLTVSFAWVLLFMSVASEGGSCSVPRPEVRGGGSCGLRDALIKLASQCCLNIVDNSVKFLFTMICFSKLRFFDSLLFKETM